MVTGFACCSLADAAPINFSPHRPHLASLVASFASSTRFFTPHLLQATTCITHLSRQFARSLVAKFSQINDFKSRSSSRMRGEADWCVDVQATWVVRLVCISAIRGCRSLIELGQATLELVDSQTEALNLFTHQKDVAIVCAGL
jgi:hypothetical protein